MKFLGHQQVVMVTAIHPLERSSSYKKCTNLLNDTKCLVYIDSSMNVATFILVCDCGIS